MYVSLNFKYSYINLRPSSFLYYVFSTIQLMLYMYFLDMTELHVTVRLITNPAP